MASMARTAGAFRMALCQLKVTADKAANIAYAKSVIADACKNGANVVTLPECFNSPYGPSYFPEYAESIPGDTSRMLSAAALENKVYIIGGSIPERDADDSLYNTCLVYGPDGALLAKHRKVHLFDIDVPGKITFKESLTLSAGDSLTTFDSEYCKIGIAICYDMRFPEVALLAADKGVSMMVYPGAFNMTTGPAHWELLLRSRALDNQIFVAGCSPARDEKSSYVAWGHSMAVSPWGDVMASAGAEESITYVDIDLARVGEVRSQIPVHQQKRHDVYSVTSKKD